MDKEREECGVASLGCMTNTLQLTVNKDVLSQKNTSDCLSIGRKMVEYLTCWNAWFEKVLLVYLIYFEFLCYAKYLASSVLLKSANTWQSFCSMKVKVFEVISVPH